MYSACEPTQTAQNIETQDSDSEKQNLRQATHNKRLHLNEPSHLVARLYQSKK